MKFYDKNKKHQTVMRIISIVFLSLLFLSATAQNEPFSYLEKISINEANNMFVKYNSDLSEVYNQESDDLSASDPLYRKFFGTKLFKTKIDRSSSDEYYVCFSSGPSGDPHLQFYKVGAVGEYSDFEVNGLQFYIPGNGFIYVSGHTNNAFNMRRKFRVENNELKEEEQPFYYVGLKTKTRKSIKLYDSRELSNPIATLPPSYDVEVLINPKDTRLFLIKTQFGLTGWFEAKHLFPRGQCAIEGLYFAGD